MSKVEDINEFIGMSIFWAFVTGLTIICVLMRPLWLIWDRRRYKIPNELHGEPLGIWRFYCLTHYSLKEDGECPNCGRSKKELVKS